MWHRAEGEWLWWYVFLTCDDRAGEAQRVFEQHRLKGDWERRVGELLTEFQLHHPPCQRLTTNQCFYALATLAYDVLQALKRLGLGQERSGEVATIEVVAGSG